MPRRLTQARETAFSNLKPYTQDVEKKFKEYTNFKLPKRENTGIVAGMAGTSVKDTIGTTGQLIPNVEQQAPIIRDIGRAAYNVIPMSPGYDTTVEGLNWVAKKWANFLNERSDNGVAGAVSNMAKGMLGAATPESASAMSFNPYTGEGDRETAKDYAMKQALYLVGDVSGGTGSIDDLSKAQRAKSIKNLDPTHEVAQPENLKKLINNMRSSVGKSTEDFVDIYHGTPHDFDEFDLSKTEGGVVWFTDNVDDLKSGDAGNVTPKLGEKLNIMKRRINSDLKLADEALDEKYFTEQLIDMGYDGVKTPSPIGEGSWYRIWNIDKLQKADIPEQVGKQADDLLSEAKKYKSAEEFVKTQTPVYHGSPVPLKRFSNKKGGVFFTDSMEDASGFAGNPDTVYEGYLNLKNPLVIDAKGAKWDKLNTKYGKSTQEILSNAKKDGYDGITFKNIVDNIGDTDGWGGESTIHYVYKPEDSFINESQLTDIWNQANKLKGN